jgi:small nuclear ribonucleoprotein (snRNP)-like protein
MKQLLLILMLLFSITCLSQEGKIILKKRGTERVITIKDSKKIRVKTKEGIVYFGNFTIVDNNTITVDNNTVLLSDIHKIKKKSSFGKYANPAFITLGSAGTLTGLGYLVTGASFLSPAIFLPATIPMFLIPASASNHNSDNWEYSVVKE